MARLLMCPPTYYRIEYEINPWMSRTHGAQEDIGSRSVGHLHHTLTGACRADIELVDPLAGLPDLVFTANAGLVFDRTVILSRFRFPVHSGEEPVFGEWFTAHGFDVVELPQDIFFEGAGDALWCGGISSPAITSAAKSVPMRRSAR